MRNSIILTLDRHPMYNAISLQYSWPSLYIQVHPWFGSSSFLWTIHVIYPFQAFVLYIWYILCLLTPLLVACFQAAEDAAADSDEEEDHSHDELKPNPKLEFGKKLPPSLEEYFLPQHVGRPLEDIDEYYQNKKVMIWFRLRLPIVQIKYRYAIFVMLNTKTRFKHN